LVAFDVSKPAAPELVSEINLGTNGWWSFSQAFTAEGLVYVSHEASEFVPLEPILPPDPASPDGTLDTTLTNSAPSGTWVSRSYLDVVDYTEARHPVVRKPVNIPGRLQGLSHQGMVLYTIGTHWTSDATYDWTEFLDASAYDDVSAHMLDSLPLPAAWPHPVRVVGTNILIGRPKYNTNDIPVGPVVVSGSDPAAASADPSAATPAPALETWYLSMEGRFTRSGSTSLATPASALVNFDALVAAQQMDNRIVLFDLSNDGALRLVGQGQPTGCVWFDLNRSAGQPARGVWIPLGAYGVASIPAAP
jgi:hypothetical protein